MKLYLTLAACLALSLTLSTCNETAHFERNAITGCWAKQMEPELYIFSIEHFSNGTHTGSVTTYRNGEKVDRLPLSDIAFEHNTLSMITNPTQRIRFTGTVDTTRQIISGKLHYQDGSTFPFDLERYTGPYCQIDGSGETPRGLSYKTIEHLPVPESPGAEEKTVIQISESDTAIHISQSDAIAVINRRHGEIYPDYPKRSSALLLAFLMDPLITDIADTWRALAKAEADVEKEIKAINDWTTTHMTYTQIEPVFSDLPGKDPWGTFKDSHQPVFKKLIPPEMLAMRVRTGKISGKCFTLVNFTISTFMRLGISPDDMIAFIVKSGSARHAMAFVKYKGDILLVNLHMIDRLANYTQEDFKPYEILGVYGLNFSQPVNVSLSRADITDIMGTDNMSLSDAFIDHYGLSLNDGNRVKINIPDMQSGNINSNPAIPYKDIIALSRYAYQSLNVAHPEYYLDASFMSSVPEQLAQRFFSADEVFNWIRTHIRYGSIFSDPQSRIMTADQVLVFQQGGYKDQAVLAHTLLKHMDIQANVIITGDNAFLKLSGRYYDFKNLNYCEVINGRQLCVL